MGFLNPTFLWFAGLVGVPIAIWLINRHRHRRRKWAAMDFLLRALRKNQRRLQFQNLLLLLVRVAILLLLALAVARPVLRERTLAAPTDAGQNWILVLDTSYSMGFRGANQQTLFDRAREMIVRMSESLLDDGDQVALMTWSYDPRVLLGRSPVSTDTRRRLIQEVEDVDLTARSLRLVPSLYTLRDLAGEFVGPTGEPEACRVILFSDLQRKDWLADAEPVSPEIGQILTELRERGTTISIADREVDEPSPLNVAVTDLSVRPELVARGLPVSISVTVENFGDRPAEGLELTLRVSEAKPGEDTEGRGEARDAQLGEVLRIESGGRETRNLAYRFDEPGVYTVVAELRSDDLVIDNSRYRVIPVEEDVRVLLVDGDPSVEETERETFFLQFALEAGDEDLAAIGTRFSPFETETIGPESLGSVDLDEYSVVIFANVAQVAPAALASLERFVADGGSLLVFLGANVDRDFYNEHLYQDGKGLLALPLGPERGDDETPVYFQFVSTGHPVARYFEEQQDRSYLIGGVVPFYHYFRFEEPEPEPDRPMPDVSILARFNDLDHSAAVFDHAFGRGRVMWFASTADKDWNRLAVWQDFVIFLHESISYLRGWSSRTFQLAVGDPFLKDYESSEFASEVVLKLPPDEDTDLGLSSTRRLAMRDIEGERRFRLSFDDTERPGLYRIDLRRPNVEKEDSVEYFAVNVGTAEGRLETMTAADFREQFNWEPELFQATRRIQDIENMEALLRGREYWRWILWSVLALLLIETALAQFFGRRAA